MKDVDSYFWGCIIHGVSVYIVRWYKCLFTLFHSWAMPPQSKSSERIMELNQHISETQSTESEH